MFDKLLEPIISNHFKWFESLNEDEQLSYWEMCFVSFGRAEFIRRQNYDKMMFGYSIAGFRHKNFRDFINEELYNTYRNLEDSRLYLKWDELEIFRNCIEERVRKSNNQIEPLQMFILDEDEDYPFLLWSVLNSNDRLDYVVSRTPISKSESEVWNESEHKQKWKQISKLKTIIDFTGYFSFMIQLYSTSINSMIWDLAPDIQLQSFKRSNTPQTFDEIFIDKENAKKVRAILESKGYTLNGQWQGVSGHLDELSCIYYALLPILKPRQKPTPTGRILYKEFGLPFHDENDGKRMRTTPRADNMIEYDNMFLNLMPKQKK